MVLELAVSVLTILKTRNKLLDSLTSFATLMMV
jgi:hypothetical protein